MNIDSNNEISIRKLVQLIKRLTGYRGKIVWDNLKPDGQPRRKVDISKAKNEFGFESSTTFEEGLKKTIILY